LLRLDGAGFLVTSFLTGILVFIDWVLDDEALVCSVGCASGFGAAFAFAGGVAFAGAVICNICSFLACFFFCFSSGLSLDGLFIASTFIASGALDFVFGGLLVLPLTRLVLSSFSESVTIGFNDLTFAYAFTFTVGGLLVWSLIFAG
jgi:hypothetical protein